MDLQTISQVSRTYGLSTRALRYYEQIGLIQSDKKDGYAYRVYSEDAILKIRRIVILRKLRIPLKQIAEILRSDDVAVLIDSFEKNLNELDADITALSTIRDVIVSFLERLNEHVGGVRMDLLEDPDLFDAVDAIALRQEPLREERSAAELSAASEKLDHLTERDVRIIRLPPMTVASIHVIGQDADGNHAEEVSGRIQDRFIAQNDLLNIHPCVRVFGFNNPDGLPDDDPGHGYERWISIPEDMEVPAPFVKKHFSGGLYAARAISMGNFEEWGRLHAWVASSEIYDFRWDSVPGVCGWLEEHLNYPDWNTTYEGKQQQLDLLLPIKRK